MLEYCLFKPASIARLCDHVLFQIHQILPRPQYPSPCNNFPLQFEETKEVLEEAAKPHPLEKGGCSCLLLAKHPGNWVPELPLT